MKYEGKFLDNWISLQRGLIVNQFCEAVRSGADTPPSVIEWVRHDAKTRLGSARRSSEGQKILLNVIDDPEALELARFVIKRESLPPIERHKEKEATAIFFRREHMRQQQPTEKQLDYLRNLGCEVVPQTKLEAHDLIEEYVGRP